MLHLLLRFAAAAAVAAAGLATAPRAEMSKSSSNQPDPILTQTQAFRACDSTEVRRQSLVALLEPPRQLSEGRLVRRWTSDGDEPELLCETCDSRSLDSNAETRCPTVPRLSSFARSSSSLTTCGDNGTLGSFSFLATGVRCRRSGETYPVCIMALSVDRQRGPVDRVICWTCDLTGDVSDGLKRTNTCAGLLTRSTDGDTARK